MQKLISKYGLAAHLALVAVAPLFLSPVCVLWLTALAAVWVMMEPSRIGDETLHEARSRVVSAIVSDPFLWVSVVVVAYAAVRFVNGGVALSYDAETSAWSLSKPLMPIMPCVVSGFGAPEFAAALGMLVVLQGCRHALGRSARSAFSLLVSSFCGMGAAVFAVLAATGSDFAVALLKCEWSEPVFLGSVFGVSLVVGTIVLLGVYERKWLRAMPLVLLSISGNAAGLFLFAPPHVHVVFGTCELLVILYTFAYARKLLPGSGEFKFLVSFSMAVTLGGVLVVSTLPEATLAARLSAYETGTFFSEGFRTIRDALSAVAFESWKECPWLGTGLGSFPLDLRFHAAEADWAVIVPGQMAPLNGYWYLLVERGIIGAVMVACPVGFLLWSWGRGLVKGFRRDWPHPFCVLGPLLLIAVLVESLADVTFSLPVVMMLVSSCLALSAGFFPKERFNG